MKKNKWIRLYNLCVRGYPQYKICRVLKRDKGQISRMTNALVDNGFLICINNRDRVRFYEATKKKLSPDECVILSTIKREKIVSRSLGRYELRKIEKCSFSCSIVDSEKSKFDSQYNKYSWDESRSIGNGNSVLVNQFSFPFKNLGGDNIIFQRYQGRNTGSDKLIIILPRLLWHKNNGDPEQYLFEIGSQAGVWFAKHFNMILGTDLKFCQRPAYCAMLTDPKLIRMAQRGSYNNVNGFDLNSSPPFNQPEIESKSWDDLEELTCLPLRVRELELEVNRLTVIIKNFNEIEKKIASIGNNIVGLEGKLDRVLDVMSRPLSTPDPEWRGYV